MARAADSPVFGPSAKVLKQSANDFLGVTSFWAATGHYGLLAN